MCLISDSDPPPRDAAMAASIRRPCVTLSPAPAATPDLIKVRLVSVRGRRGLVTAVRRLMFGLSDRRAHHA